MAAIICAGSSLDGPLLGDAGTLGAGPVACIERFDSSRAEGESAGARRGAQMGVLRCDHPDVEEFIHAKDSGDLKNFNLSIAVTDAFMQAVEDDAEFELVDDADPALGERPGPPVGVGGQRRIN